MGYKQQFHGIAQYWAIIVTNSKPFTATIYYIPYNLVPSTLIPAHEQSIGSLESRGLSSPTCFLIYTTCHSYSS